jgi:hypothetical protein
VRIATAACLVASGLVAGGSGASIAFAEPWLTTGDHGDKRANDAADTGSEVKQKPSPDDKKTPGDGDRKRGAAAGADADHPQTEREKTENEKNDGGNGKPDGKGGDKPRDEGQKGGDPAAEDPGTDDPGTGDPDTDGPSTEDPTPTTKPPAPPTTENPPPTTENPPPDDPGNCDDKKSDDHCSPGWPWWPWPWPWNPGQPPGAGGGDGGGRPEVPSGRPRIVPQMQLPPQLRPPTEQIAPSVVDSVPGVGVAAAELPVPAITLPVIVAPAVPLSAGGGGGGSAGAAPLPAAPRVVSAEPPAGREPLPANAGSNVAVPASSYRVGYSEYLRTAGLSQVAALAVPGIAGMLVLTGAGGLVGYRQAKAGHAVHTNGTARFVN